MTQAGERSFQLRRNPSNLPAPSAAGGSIPFGVSCPQGQQQLSPGSGRCRRTQHPATRVAPAAVPQASCHRQAWSQAGLTLGCPRHLDRGRDGLRGPRRAPAHCTQCTAEGEATPRAHPPPSAQSRRAPTSPPAPAPRDFAQGRQHSTVSTVLIKSVQELGKGWGRGGETCYKTGVKRSREDEQSSSPEAAAQSRGSLSAGTGAPLTPRQRGPVLPMRGWNGFGWLHSCCHYDPRTDG